jgi:serine/threonine protein kinase
MNVIVDGNERAVLIDFKKSVIIQKHDRVYVSSNIQPSRWQAPELRICGQGTYPVPDIRSEIWSLGCVMLEVRIPFIPATVCPNSN